MHPSELTLAMNLALNDAAHEAIELARDDVLLAFANVLPLAQKHWQEKREHAEVWTDALPDDFCSSPWDVIATSPAEYALFKVSIMLECGEFEMPSDLETAGRLIALIKSAVTAGADYSKILEMSNWLTRENAELATLVFPI